MDAPPPCLPFTCEGCRAQLPLVAMLNSAAVHIRVQVSLWTQVFISLGLFLRNCQAVSTVTASFCFPASSVSQFQSVPILTNTHPFRCSDDSRSVHAKRCPVTALLGTPSATDDAEHLFVCWPLVCLLWENSLFKFLLIFNWIMCFFVNPMKENGVSPVFL